MRRVWQVLGLIYLLLLGASHLVRHFDHREPRREPAQRVVELPVVRAGGGPSDGAARQDAGRTVRLAYREWGGAADRAGSGGGAGPAAGPEASDDEPLPIVLLHGSPGSSLDFQTLGPYLGRHRRAIALDLPGFGGSERHLPDYSIRAHAAYTDALLDRLGIERAHVLGFSMGGGVALELYSRRPSAVASLTLLSAIGVQEIELLGDYQLNRLLHGLQLGLLRLVQEGVPHFGALDHTFFGREYARNFFDSDQRPLRGVLERFEPPLLVLHGKNDPLVPEAAALEHHRLVPQSELEMLDSDHFFIFGGGERIGPTVESFLERVESGAALRRAAAPPERVAAAAVPFDPRSLEPVSGFFLGVVMLLLALATLASEDLACIGAGLLVAQGRMEFVPAAVACFLGIYVGDLMLFWAGRLIGRPALSIPPFKWLLSERAVATSSAWFRRRGIMVIILSRFVPGSRLPTYFAAGLLRTSFWRFAGYFFLASAVWTPALVALAALAGHQLLAHLAWVEDRALLLFLLLVVLLIVLRQLLVPALSHNGRRRLVGLWRRWEKWEFWPPWRFYPPLVLYILYLGIKHRGFTLFTAANPALPAGGFVGESKGDILTGLSAAAARLPAWTRLPDRGEDEGAEEAAERRLAAIEEFRQAAGLDYPVVLKPNVGQRGSGVAIVDGAEEAREYLRHHPGPTLAQQHVPGVELGVFYYRMPEGDGAAAGGVPAPAGTGSPAPDRHILGVTEKRMPAVIGDGERTVEQLILDDPRAVALADLYIERQGERRWEVPAEGERVQLAELGTHCRGAIFLDGGHLMTPALAAEIDRVSRTFEGFYFGRYDLRAESLEAMRSGRFKIIELNGVTSETTDVYDPKHGLADAYRILARQWRLAFEIGAANRDRGAKPASAWELARAVVRFGQGR